MLSELIGNHGVRRGAVAGAVSENYAFPIPSGGLPAPRGMEEISRDLRGLLRAGAGIVESHRARISRGLGLANSLRKGRAVTRKPHGKNSLTHTDQVRASPADTMSRAGIEDSTSASQAMSRYEEAPKLDRPRVGLMTANPNISQTLRHLLGRDGYDVVLPDGNGSDRFVPFTKHRLCVVISDCAKDTMQADLRDLRAVLAAKRTPIVVLADDAGAATYALAHGASKAFVRPLDVTALLKMARWFAHREKKNSHAGQPGSGRAARGDLLVASDDVGQLIALGSALSRGGGYHVSLARGSSEALRQAERHHPPAILLDLRLDDELTRELIAHLSATQPDMRLILITGEDEKKFMVSVKTWPIAGIIEKPVPLLSLSAEIQRMAGVQPAGVSRKCDDVFRGELLRVLG
jgi:DNA-binding response OmpR family regulator